MTDPNFVKVAEEERLAAAREARERMVAEQATRVRVRVRVIGSDPGVVCG